MKTSTKLDVKALDANKNIRNRGYWKKRLADFELNNYFPSTTVHDEKEVAGTAAYTLTNIPVYTQLHQLALQPKAKHLVLLAALGVMARKSASVAEVALFTPRYADAAPDAWVPVRMSNFEELSFRDFLTTMKEQLQQDMLHAQYPVDKMFGTEMEQLQEYTLVGLQLAGIHETGSVPTLAPDLLFDIAADDALTLTLRYNTGRFDAATVEKIAALYLLLLGQLLCAPDKETRSFELISVEEKAIILEQFNDTARPFPGHLTLIDHFTAVAARYPHREALRFEGQTLTYSQLNERANQVAHYLLERVSGKGAVVGVHLERSLDMMVAIYGILKAGLIYMPLSVSYPVERVLYTLQNSQAQLVFTSDTHASQLPGMHCVNVADALTAATDEINLAASDDIAYIIYTSGSTGKPKGVPIKHVSIVNRLHWMQQTYLLEENDVILQKTPTVFDVSVWELFWWAMYGARLVLASPGAEKDPDALCRIIDEEGITVLHFVPSMLNILLVYLKEYNTKYHLRSIKHLFASGEELKAADAAAFLQYCSAARVHNLYGPTEATVDVSYFEVTRAHTARTIPIGKPIDNTTLVVLNNELQLQPIGFTGELYIGGVNLSPGYYHQPGLTSERFIKSPLNENEILYKTGDLARWLPDGNIEYLGRIDNQVKVRGNRIELGEIELAIQAFAGVKNAIVLAKEANRIVQLVGYLITEEAFAEEALVAHLSAVLPEYMIPSYFITIDTIPVTVNGKVDRQLLLSLKKEEQTAYAAPETLLEKQIAGYWSAILGIDHIGLDDHFFRIGGDSILAVRLIGTLNNELAAGISMVDLYAHATLRELAVFIEQSQVKENEEPFRLVEEELRLFEQEFRTKVADDNIEAVYPMSDIEKAMFYSHKTRPDDILYFEQIMQAVEYEVLDIALLQQTLDMLVKKHEVLRTGYSLQHLAHIIYRDLPAIITFHNLSHLPEQERNTIILHQLEQSRKAHFDLNKAPLWRLIVYKIAEGRHELLFEYHHAVFDGWSISLLITEMNEIYRKLIRNIPVEVALLKTGYRDFIRQEVFHKRDADTHTFWRNELKGYKRLKLNEGLVTEKVFRSAREKSSRQLVEDLEKLAKAKNTTVKTLLFAAYLYTMRVLSGERDLCVGLVTFNRPLKVDGDKILGCFLNTIPFRIVIPESFSWLQLVQLVDAKMVQLKRYETLSLIEISQTTGHALEEENPFFDTMFNVINWHVMEKMEIEDLVQSDAQRLDFDSFLRANTFFDVNYNVNKNRIYTMHEYSSPFMPKDTFEHYTRIFDHLLAAAIENPDRVVGAGDELWQPYVQQVQESLGEFVAATESGQAIPVAHQQVTTWKQLKKNGITSITGLPLIIDIEGMLDSTVLETTIGQAILRHDVLRTTFTENGDVLLQQPLAAPHFTMQYRETADDEELISELVQAAVAQPFANGDTPVRALLLQTRRNKYKLILTFHALIADRFTIVSLAGEILANYRHVLSGLVPVKVQSAPHFAGYTAWQHTMLPLLNDFLVAQWKKVVGEHWEMLPLPAVTGQPFYAPASKKRLLTEQQTQQLLRYAQRQNVDAGLVLQAVFQLLLHKYYFQDAFVMSTTVDNRGYQEGVHQLAGALAAIVPVKSQLHAQDSFETFVNRIKAAADLVAGYPALPVEVIGKRIADDAISSLFDVHFSYHTQTARIPKICGLKFQVHPTPAAAGVFQLDMLLQKQDDTFAAEITFNQQRIEESTVQTLLDKYLLLLDMVLTNATHPVASISLVAAAEQQVLLETFNQTSQAYPADKTLIDLFEAQAAATPEAIAIRNSTETISYATLSRLSDSVAAYLRTEAGVQPGDCVGVLLEREMMLLPVLYGILKAGAAYIPMDRNYPVERVNAIVEDAGVKTLVSRSSHLPASLKSFAGLVDLDSRAATLQSYPVTEPLPVVDNRQLAYVIYTSGSTGKPKGVMIEHRSAVNLVWDMQRRYPVTSEDVYLLKTNYCFDVSVAEIFGWFLGGGSLYLLPVRGEADAALMLDEIARHKITHVNFVPSMFTFFVEEQKKDAGARLGSLRYIFLAGEALSAELVKKFREYNTSVRLENLYGPTEATIYCSGYSLSALGDARKVPIGVPLGNVKLYILDKHLQLQPIGVAGELCIGGVGVARGYLNNTALTAEKFIANPFEAGVIYRTGDLVKWQADGNVEFLGRIDDQVKVRGFRIQLGEIEYQMSTHHQALESVVVVKENAGEKYLVGYYTGSAFIPVSEWMNYLSSKLPDYMVPSYYVQLESFPQTTSGKINRKALPDPELQADTAYVAPTNEIEEQLVAIWAEVLKLDKELISVDRSFFELGGHSLRAMVLVNRIFKDLNVAIPLNEILSNNTIEKMANYIENEKWLKEETASSLEAAQEFFFD